MNKYKLTDNGVLDQETGMSIPNAEGNRHWKEYQQWLAEGNTPDPIRTHIESQELKKQEINQWRAVDLQSMTVSHNGNMFDADKTARENMTSVVSAIQAGIPVPDPLNWRTADNITVQLSHNDIVTISGLMLDKVQLTYEKSWLLKNQVDQTVDQAGLDVIEW